MWNWQPTVLIGVALLAGGYLSAIGPWRRRFGASAPVSRGQVISFLLGALIILLALVSPLDELGDEYLFSAHMTQHLLLTLVAPPLLLLGTPGWLLRPLLRRRSAARAGRVLTKQVVAFVLFNGVFLAWHLPTFYEATLQSESIHVVEHLMFIATAVLNWWPILSPLPELPRLSYPAQILYLFLEALPATVLGALLVFAPAPLIPTYATAPRLFGLDVMTDQQVSGLIMWMPGGMIYLIALAVVFFKWLGREEGEAQSRLAPGESGG